MAVFVLDKKGKPLMPTSEKRARKMLACHRAVVINVVPFVIRLKDVSAEDCVFQDVVIKFDPGSKTTGIAVVHENGAVLNLFELVHRGRQVSESLTARRAFRRRRRGNLRSRQARFNNRSIPSGWLPPSIRHRVEAVSNFAKKLQKYLPLTAAVLEFVKFDTQKMVNPEIGGVEYQQGELFGYEVKEYLLEKFNHRYTYCGATKVPLEVEHVQPKSKGGSNRVSNLVIACVPCNKAKNNQPIEVFLENKPDVLLKIKKQLKTPLRDAAAMNSTRFALKEALEQLFPVELGTGAQTKYNRSKLGVPKTHALDAACAGVTPTLARWQVPSLQVKCMGRGRYARTLLNKYGFPRGYFMPEKRVFGFKTGDLIKVSIPTGKKAGTYQGRVAIRASGYFGVQTKNQKVTGICYKHCSILQQGDGYQYDWLPFPPTTLLERCSSE